ncbi:hypothetical protein SO802_031766 [Lithocarpus litseifolius]|uniref:Uncharacterized protein n=1 Tax=Lithocarpus litseifolius TaxID=425828 RepID=A0AAW2BPM6_9ROSI
MIWGDVCGEFGALILGDLLNDHEGDDGRWDELWWIGWVREINGGCVSYEVATWLCERVRTKAYQVPCCTDAWESHCREDDLALTRGR